MTTRLSPSQEEYLKAIHGLQEEKGYARVTDVAKSLRVAKPAVTAALRHLQPLGLVDHRPYEGVRLTEKGAQKALGLSGRFSILFHFLTEVLGVEEAQAETDAGLIEHYASSATLDRIVDLLRFFEADEQRVLVEAFREFRRGCESDDTCPECDFHCEIVIQEPDFAPRAANAPAAARKGPDPATT